MKLKIKKLIKDAIVPDQPYKGDAGFDLYANEDIVIDESGGRGAVSTGISMAIPEGYVGLIWDKSGIAIKKGIKVMGGVVDSGYRGEIIVGLINLSNDLYIIKKGQKIAQLLIQKVETPTIVEVDRLDETHRGDKSFGSSGI